MAGCAIIMNMKAFLEQHHEAILTACYYVKAGLPGEIDMKALAEAKSEAKKLSPKNPQTKELLSVLIKELGNPTEELFVVFMQLAMVVGWPS